MKIENLLYFDDEKIKLCDFGSISNKCIDFGNIDKKDIDGEMTEFEKSTTLMYWPPEMCDAYLNYKVDQ